jgi:hypothetical protein
MRAAGFGRAVKPLQRIHALPAGGEAELSLPNMLFEDYALSFRDKKARNTSHIQTFGHLRFLACQYQAPFISSFRIENIKNQLNFLEYRRTYSS